MAEAKEDKTSNEDPIEISKNESPEIQEKRVP